jgi:integrase
MKMLNNNPAEGVKPPKKHKKQIDPYSRAEFIVFYEAIKSHRLFAFYRLSAFTGARRGELLALRKSDIDFTKKEITINKTRGLAGSEVIEEGLTKTDLPRTISIDEETCQILKDHFKKMTLELSSSPFPLQGSDYVFTQEDGSALYPSTPSNLFLKVIRKVGLRPQRLHDLRHFHATELIRLGANLLDIQFRLGHKDLKMTLGTYGHLRPEDKSRIAEHFAKVMSIN